jgi:hypothetical protein
MPRSVRASAAKRDGGQSDGDRSCFVTSKTLSERETFFRTRPTALCRVSVKAEHSSETISAACLGK